MEHTGCNPQLGVPPNLSNPEVPNFIDPQDHDHFAYVAYATMEENVVDGKVQSQSMWED